MKSRATVLSASVLALTIMLSGCGAGTDPSGSSQEPVSIPNSELGKQADWVLGQFDDGLKPADEWQKRLSAKLLEQMSAEKLVEVLKTDVVSRAPFVVTAFKDSDHKAVISLKDSSDKKVTMTLSIDPADGKISGIFFN